MIYTVSREDINDKVFLISHEEFIKLVEIVPFCNYVNDTTAGVRPCIIIDKGGIANGN